MRSSFAKYINIKWWKEKKKREEKRRKLLVKELELGAIWHDMLYPVKKMITITGTDAAEVSQKASAALAQLSEFKSFDNQDTPYPGQIKRLHSIKDDPVMEMNQNEEGNTVKITATITYTQYELKPGFTEEEFYAAAEAGDKAEEEYLQHEKECYEFGMDALLVQSMKTQPGGCEE